MRCASRDQVETVLLGRLRLEESLRVEGDRPSLCLVGGRPEGFEVGVLPKSEEHLRPRRRVHDVVGLVLRVRETEDVACVLLRGVALDREVPALERVEVVEADREGRAEPREELGPEDSLGLCRHQQLEAHLELGVVAEQESALGRDQLVGPREIRRVGRNPEPAS